MKLHPRQAKKIVGDPEKTASAVDLIYIAEDQLTIHRKRHGRGFMYFEEGKKIKNAQAIKRFKALVIPPAWEEVRICPLAHGHLQVIGKDSKGRTQYRYHPHWNKIRNSTKFFRMIAFGEALSAIRKQVQKDLRKRKMTKRKCLALVIRLMEETHIRIGSNYYASKNKSYGLSTMRDKHVKHSGNSIKFEFTGKKGVKHSVEVEDKRLQRLVIQCEEIPGWELFQYYDEDGEHHTIDSGMVNAYIQEISGDAFTAKDFRTWAASKVFLEAIIEMEDPETKTGREKNVVEACNISAQELGNTRTVCRNYYIHPALINKYLSGTLLSYLEAEKSSSNIKELDEIEQVMLHIIEDYSFEIDLE